MIEFDEGYIKSLESFREKLREAIKNVARYHRNRIIRGSELPDRKPGEKNPFLTDDGQLKPGIKRILTARLYGGDQYGIGIKYSDEGDETE